MEYGYRSRGAAFRPYALPDGRLSIQRKFEGRACELCKASHIRQDLPDRSQFSSFFPLSLPSPRGAWLNVVWFTYADDR